MVYDIAAIMTPGLVMAAAHLIGAEHQDQRDNDIHQRVHYRVHEGEYDQYLELSLYQLIVRLSEAELFAYLAHAGLDDAYARHILLHDRVVLSRCA